MNILFNGTDITSSVQPTVLQLTDNAGGKPDSITAIFSDTEGLWSKWRPAKNDHLRVKHDGHDSGVMYIDHLGQKAGQFEIKALSIPQSSKTARSKGWENVRLLELASEIAARYGFSIKTYNVTNFLYGRVNQIEDADFAFLADRCELEGYALKINDGALVIYDESKEEQKPADIKRATIRASDMIGWFEFANKSIDIYSRCVVRSQVASGFIQGESVDQSINGPTLTRNLQAADQTEAMRWARGLLRGFNKHMVTGKFDIDLRPGLAAGSSIKVEDVGLFDGQYFVHRLVHDLIRNRTSLTVRKPLDGY